MGLFQARQEYVANLYAEQMNNTNLTEEQHLMIQRLSTVRHKLHSMGWKIYLNRPMSEDIKEFFKMAPADFEKIGLPFPKSAFKTFSTLETSLDIFKVSDPSKEEVLNSCASFLYEKEFINDVLEKWISDIDLEYGTAYMPSHSLHRKSLAEYQQDDLRYIAQCYDRGKVRVALEDLACDRSTIHNIQIDKSQPGIKQITGMYETTPFSCIMTDAKKVLDMTLHTPNQDLEPSMDVARDIARACAIEMERTKDVVVEKEKKVIFLSMDNTLMDLTGGLVDINGQVQLNSIYEALEKPGFFKGLEAITPVVSAVKAFIKNHPEIDVCIFSTAKPDEPPGVKAQKNDWLNRNLPEIPPERRFFRTPDVPKTDLMRRYPGYECMLIDSDIDNLQLFEISGGTSIYSALSTSKHLQRNNIFIDKSPANIYNSLEKMLNVDHVNYSQGQEHMKKRTNDQTISLS